MIPTHQDGHPSSYLTRWAQGGGYAWAMGNCCSSDRVSGSGKPQPATRSYGCPLTGTTTQPSLSTTQQTTQQSGWSGLLCIHPTKPFRHLIELLSHPTETLNHSTEPFSYPMERFNHWTDHFNHPTEPFNRPTETSNHLTDHFNHPTEHFSIFLGYLSASSYFL